MEEQWFYTLMTEHVGKKQGYLFLGITFVLCWPILATVYVKLHMMSVIMCLYYVILDSFYVVSFSVMPLLESF